MAFFDGRTPIVVLLEKIIGDAWRMNLVLSELMLERKTCLQTNERHNSFYKELINQSQISGDATIPFCLHEDAYVGKFHTTQEAYKARLKKIDMIIAQSQKAWDKMLSDAIQLLEKILVTWHADPDLPFKRTWLMTSSNEYDQKVKLDAPTPRALARLYLEQLTKCHMILPGKFYLINCNLYSKW